MIVYGIGLWLTVIPSLLILGVVLPSWRLIEFPLAVSLIFGSVGDVVIGRSLLRSTKRLEQLKGELEQWQAKDL